MASKPERYMQYGYLVYEIKLISILLRHTIRKQYSVERVLNNIFIFTTNLSFAALLSKIGAGYIWESIIVFSQLFQHLYKSLPFFKSKTSILHLMGEVDELLFNVEKAIFLELYNTNDSDEFYFDIKRKFTVVLRKVEEVANVSISRKEVSIARDDALSFMKKYFPEIYDFISTIV
ncbi:hypothetical protein [Vibrio owensii]|uniref:hypothetical protein n=1 Tax=Vibrio owensii TaxID=696485 RepID=UPI003DA16F07